MVNYNGSEDAANETVAAIKAAGGDAVSVRCNVSDFTACQEMIESLIKEYKHMDILVNNAGITRDDLLMRMKESDFDAAENNFPLIIGSTIEMEISATGTTIHFQND